MTATYVLLARVPDGRMPAFDAYEAVILPLLADYGGQLQRRLRTVDDRTEIHLVSFPSSEDFAAFLADPRRTAAAPLRESSGAVVELFVVRDVPP